MQEHWCDRVVFVGVPTHQETAIHETLAGPLPEIFRVCDLQKTKEELQLIEEMNYALNRVLADFGRSPQYIDPSRVHILTKEEFKTKVEGGDTAGKTQFGHVYLIRKRFVDLAGDLAHELVHAAGFFCVQATGTKTSNNKTSICFRKRRDGLVFLQNVKPEILRFNSVNEAATEQLAHAVRMRFASVTNMLAKNEKRYLRKSLVYRACIRFLRCAISEISRKTEHSEQTLRRMAYNDYLRGSCDFFRLVSREDKQLLRALFELQAETKDVRRAAAKLGYSLSKK